MTKLYVDEIGKTSRDNKPIQVAFVNALVTLDMM